MGTTATMSTRRRLRTTAIASEAAVATWGNMLFVNLAAATPDAPAKKKKQSSASAGTTEQEKAAAAAAAATPAALDAGFGVISAEEHLGELVPELAGYPLHEMVIARQKEVTPKANGKFREGGGEGGGEGGREGGRERESVSSVCWRRVTCVRRQPFAGASL